MYSDLTTVATTENIEFSLSKKVVIHLRFQCYVISLSFAVNSWMTSLNNRSFSLCRCPSDNTVSFHSTVSSRQRFSIQAFRFLNSSTAVYFHCLVFLCHTSSSDYRCRSGCQGNNIYRGKRAVTNSIDEPSKYYLLEMEVRRSEEGGKYAIVDMNQNFLP